MATVSPNLSSAAPMGLQGWDRRSPTDDRRSSTKLVFGLFKPLPKFANLPNGIIREIVSYTGATYKKRNDKYMGQIPKNDQRYTMLRMIPKRVNSYAAYSVTLPFSYATTYIVLKKSSKQYITYCVSVATYPHENREVIGYYQIIQDDITGQRRRYAHEIVGVIYT